MQFYSFGDPQAPNLILIHGLATTWFQSFSHSLPILAQKYHCIVVGVSGHDPSEESVYTDPRQEAMQLEAYIRAELGGQVFALYGSSLGVLTALELCTRGQIQVKNLILDGPVLLPLAPLAGIGSKVAGLFTSLLASGKLAPLLRLGGMSRYVVREFLYRAIGRKSIENAFYAMLHYSSILRQGQPLPDLRTAIWYGSREAYACSWAAWRLMKLLPRARRKVFPRFGHGDLLDHSLLFAREVEDFLARAEEEDLPMSTRPKLCLGAWPLLAGLLLLPFLLEILPRKRSKA